MLNGNPGCRNEGYKDGDGGCFVKEEKQRSTQPDERKDSVRRIEGPSELAQGDRWAVLGWLKLVG